MKILFLLFTSVMSKSMKIAVNSGLPKTPDESDGYVIHNDKFTGFPDKDQFNDDYDTGCPLLVRVEYNDGRGYNGKYEREYGSEIYYHETKSYTYSLHYRGYWAVIDKKGRVKKFNRTVKNSLCPPQ